MSSSPQIYHYHVTAKVQNYFGVLARVTVLLRKFNINIHDLKTEPLDDTEKFHIMRIGINTIKDPDQFAIIIRKLRRLIPVLEVTYQQRQV